MIDLTLIQDQLIAFGYLVIAVILWGGIYFVYYIPTMLGILLSCLIMYSLAKLLLWAFLR